MGQTLRHFKRGLDLATVGSFKKQEAAHRLTTMVDLKTLSLSPGRLCGEGPDISFKSGTVYSTANTWMRMACQQQAELAQRVKCLNALYLGRDVRQIRLSIS